MPHLLVFGSLRKTSKRGYNYQRLGPQRHIRDVMLEGYTLHDLGPYPAVCVGPDTIKAELHEVDDKTHQRIRAMELGASYAEDTVQIDGTDAYIYTMPKERLARYPKVESGDWA